MKTYNYTEKQQNLSVILNIAEKEDVIIKRQDGLRFKLICMKEDASRSPFDVTGITTNISTQEIIDILRESKIKN
jgi:hypothetical protein